MIFCIPVTPDGQVGPGWGRASRVALADLSTPVQVDRWEVHQVDWDIAHDQGTHGSHHARIVRFLRDNQVGCVVAEHMGPGMRQVLQAMRLPVVIGAAGDAHDAVLLAAALLTDEGLFSGPEESASLTRSSSSEQSASLTRSSSSEQSADLTRAVVVGGLIVDMDGTLVDSHAVVRQVWSSWANSQGLDPAEVVSYSTGRRPEATLKHFAPDDPDPQSTTARLEEQEVSLTEPITEVPGARALLTSLMAEDEPESPERPVVALVTSATRRLAQVRMEAARVPFPQVAVCGEDVPQGKPAPDGYLAAAGALGVPITDCLVLEDAPAGVAGALAAGAKLIVVGGEAGQPDHPNQLAAVQDLTGIRARRLPDGRIELTYPAVRT